VALQAARLGTSTPEAHARAEAQAIRELPADGRALRLHVSGDARTPRAARILGSAVTAWRAAGGGPAWTYTHAWARVPRAAWGAAVAVRASLNRLGDARRAMRRGYRALAAVFSEAEFDAAAGRRFAAAGVAWVPCPEQSGRAASCAACRLCWRERIHIAFRRH
jgi:hypothetical protein